MGLANLQSGLGGTAQDFSRAQIAGLGSLGSAQQAQAQAYRCSKTNCTNGSSRSD